MTLLSIVLLIAIIIVFIAARKGVASAPVAVVALAIVGAIVLAVNLWSAKKSSPMNRLLSDEEAAGNAVGEIIMRDIPGRRILVLRHPPLARFKREITDVRFSGFVQALKGKSVEVVVAGPNRGSFGSDDPAMTLFSEENLAADLHAWLAKHPDIKTIVSMLPSLPQMPLDRTAYGFVDVRDAGWVESVRSGRLKAAIIYRFHPLPAGTNPETNDGLPLKYMLVTAANLEQALKEQPGF